MVSRNVFEYFVNAKQRFATLRDTDQEDGMLQVHLSPKHMGILEIFLGNTGNNVADNVLKQGFVQRGMRRQAFDMLFFQTNSLTTSFKVNVTAAANDTRFTINGVTVRVARSGSTQSGAGVTTISSGSTNAQIATAIANSLNNAERKEDSTTNGNAFSNTKDSKTGISDRVKLAVRTSIAATASNNVVTVTAKGLSDAASIQAGTNTTITETTVHSPMAYKGCIDLVMQSYPNPLRDVPYPDREASQCIRSFDAALGTFTDGARKMMDMRLAP